MKTFYANLINKKIIKKVKAKLEYPNAWYAEEKISKNQIKKMEIVVGDLVLIISISLLKLEQKALRASLFPFSSHLFCSYSDFIESNLNKLLWFIFVLIEL